MSRDEIIEALESHPLASPELSFAESNGTVTGSRGETATGVSSGQESVAVTTRFEVGPERVDDAVRELREQAEVLGYEFTEMAPGSPIIYSLPVDGLFGAPQIQRNSSSVVYSIGSTVP